MISFMWACAGFVVGCVLCTLYHFDDKRYVKNIKNNDIIGISSGSGMTWQQSSKSE